jgi:hypothetical protein
MGLGWVIAIRLVIDFGELIKVLLKGGRWEKRWVGKEEVWGLLGFVTLVCVWVYFCCSGGCLCQGLQEAGVVYSWYSRLLSGW